MKIYKLKLAFVITIVLLLAMGNGAVAASGGGAVYEVFPTGNSVQDVQNVQAAIDGAADGDTILLKAGTFNFGDWKTNPIPGGYIVINKGVTVKGEGFSKDGTPRTIIQGGGYRQKNHWDNCEWGVVTFAGDTSGGVLKEVWLQEPHFYAVFASGFCGQNHENITIRNVKITDITQDIPVWDQYSSIGRSIDMGAAVPEYGMGGPSGTVTIEGCDISNTGSSVDLDYIDPDNGTLYYKDPTGNDLFSNDSQAIGLWMYSTTSFVIHDNKLTTQNEGIVMEAMAGSGSILITDNDIIVEPTNLTRHWMRGIRFDASYPGMVDTPYTRAVRITDNHIRVLAEPEVGFLSAGIMLGTDNGVNVYDGQTFVKGNEIEILGGDAALVFGYNRGPDWVSVLTGAEIRNNRIRGTARYGILSVDGAQYCKIFGNKLARFEPSVAHIGFYGPGTHDNTVRGYTGVVIEADGAYNNHFTGKK